MSDSLSRILRVAETPITPDPENTTRVVTAVTRVLEGTQDDEVPEHAALRLLDDADLASAVGPAAAALLQDDADAVVGLIIDLLLAGSSNETITRLLDLGVVSDTCREAIATKLVDHPAVQFRDPAADLDVIDGDVYVTVTVTLHLAATARMLGTVVVPTWYEWNSYRARYDLSYEPEGHTEQVSGLLEDALHKQRRAIARCCAEYKEILAAAHTALVAGAHIQDDDDTGAVTVDPRDGRIRPPFRPTRDAVACAVVEQALDPRHHIACSIKTRPTPSVSSTLVEARRVIVALELPISPTHGDLEWATHEVQVPLLDDAPSFDDVPAWCRDVVEDAIRDAIARVARPKDLASI
jgi:hypothetical protein